MPAGNKEVDLKIPSVMNGWSTGYDLPAGGVLEPSNLNLYGYAHANPARYVDPDGNFAPLIAAGVGAIGGAVLSGGWSIASDLWNHRDIDWGNAGRSAVKGAIGGAVAGATFGFAAPVAGGLAMQAVNAGASRAVPLLAGAAVGAGSGAVGDVAAQGGAMALGWQDDFSVSELAFSAAFGGVFGGVGREFKIGNARVAPFGNRAGHQQGTMPHYHRSVKNPKKSGESLPGQSMKRHRPWDTSPADKSFWDRF